ncbi:MAG: helix-turn-helix transcriptional regulator [Clostridia bacterium]|nr:helix-turn-helix transcriptional regulator [Clostridia bacterium]
MLLEEILRYMQTLKKDFGLQLSLHGPKTMLGDFPDYRIHSNPYCMLIKQSPQLWHKCHRQQSKIVSHEVSSCGTCFAGVFEYIIPLRTGAGEKTQVFMCISGYRNDARAQRQLRMLERSFGMDMQVLKAAYEKYLRPMPDAPPDAEVLAPLVKMLEQYFSNPKNRRGSNSDYIYAHAIAYIHQHYREKIRLEDICNFCHCSKSYISHMFKKRTGCSVSNYIMQLRLEKAKKLLERERITVKAAAEAVGFPEPYYFSNSFKKYFNIAPSAIRKDDLHEI